MSWLTRADASTRLGQLMSVSGSCTRGCSSGEKLHWWGKGITDSECLQLVALLGSQSGHELKNLLLGSNTIGDGCLSALSTAASRRHLNALQALGLSGNAITDAGCLASPVSPALSVGPSTLPQLPPPP